MDTEIIKPTNLNNMSVKSRFKIDIVKDKIGVIEINGAKGYLCEGDVYFLYNIINSLPDNGIFVEVGSFMGLSTIVLAQSIIDKNKKGTKFYSVNMWEDKYLIDVYGNKEGLSLFELFKNNIKNAHVEDYNNIIRGDSKIVHSEFDNESVDIIFIDGDHTFEGCYSDLINWYPKLKPQGIVIGHDCVINQDVHKAVEKFCRENKLLYSIFMPPGSHYIFQIYNSKESALLEGMKNSFANRDYIKAENLFNTLNTNVYHSPYLLNLLANIKIELSKYNEALLLLNFLLSEWNPNVEILNNLGLVHFYKNNYEESEHYFNKILEIESSNIIAKENIAVIKNIKFKTIYDTVLA